MVSISAYLLIQSPPLGIAPASVPVPSPRYRSCFSPLPSVSLRIQSPWRRGGRRLGAARVPRRGWAPRGCHGGGAAAARVPRRRGGRCAGAPEEGWAPRGCHGGGVSAARDNKTTHTNYHKPPQKHGDFWHLQTSPTVFYLTGRTSGETSVVCRPLRRTERPLFRKLRIPSRKIGRHNL